MKSPYIFLLLLFSGFLNAQTTADFENLNLQIGSYDNDAGDTGFFESGHVLLPNEYVDDPSFPYWNGWSLSAMTDVATPGFDNQYSCIAGSGVEGSNTYAVGYVFGSLTMSFSGDGQGGVVNGFYLNNSTYAYLSMKDGDSFAKKFGGVTGNDPDFFKLTIRKSLNGVAGTDSVEFYLADYRFTNNSQDYIVKDWTWVDLSGLGPADQLTFSVSSSDVGAFGINTPTYFCVDNVQTADTPTETQEQGMAMMKIWPNPVAEALKVDWPGNISAMAWLSDAYGRKIKSLQINTGQNHIPVSDLSSGIFTLQVAYQGGMLSQIFIKH